MKKILLVFLVLFSILLAADISVSEAKAIAKQKYGLSDSQIQDVAQQVAAENRNDAVKKQKKVKSLVEKAGGVKSSKSDQEIVDDILFEKEYEKSPIEEDFSSDLKQFGYDIFNQVALSFTPLESMPVGDDYILGPGDELNIYIWGSIQQNFSLLIDKEGNVILPKAGKINLSNVNLGDAKKIIKKTLEKYFANFTLAISTGRLKTMDIFVLGEVETPGKYSLNSLSTVLHALYASGGPRKNGTLRNIKIIRNQKTIKAIDLYKLFLYGNNSDDMPLRPGDTIYVPKIGNVAAIHGEVKTPAIYELRGKTNLFGLLNIAGKYTRNTFVKKINLIRKNYKTDKLELQTLEFASWKDFEERSRAIPVYNGDSIEISAMNAGIDNYIQVNGAVVRPGKYEAKKAQNLSAAIDLAGGFKDDVYFDRIEVARKDDKAQVFVLPFNLQLVSSKNIKLEKEDVVTVFPKSKFAMKYAVSIKGEVKSPGSFPFYPNMTIKDLLFHANGLTKYAYPEVYLLRESKIEKDRVIRIDNININEDFLLQEGDQVFVRKTLDYEDNGTIEISGAVNYPGIYPIYPRESIKDFIKRVGGLSPKAFVKGMALYRHTGEVPVAPATQQVISGDILAYQVESLTDFDRIRINFEDLLNNPDNDYRNLVLKDGDKIMVPEIPVEVKVVGGVYNQGSFVYANNSSLGHYINKAGSYRKDAEKGEMYVVHVDGTVTKTDNHGFGIERGDTIVVPTKVLREVDLVKVILDWTQIVFNFATTWKVVFGL